MRQDEIYAALNKKIKMNGEGVTPEMLNNAVSAALQSAKDYTDDAVGGIVNFSVAVVDSLPTEDIDGHTIYFVPNLDGTHDEYMYINDAWELIGNTTVDLTGYAKEEDIPTKTSELTNDSGYINVPNSATNNGYVPKGEGHPNQVWKTDENGNPGWKPENEAITVDSVLSEISTNPVQNKVVTANLKEIKSFFPNNDKDHYYYMLIFDAPNNHAMEFNMELSLSTYIFSVFPSPSDDNGVASSDLGRPYTCNRWNNIYATNGTIQTSDRNEKNTIEELTDEKAQTLIYGLKPSTYQMNGGTSGRTHWGMISQDIEELLSNLGWTSSDFAGFIKSPKMHIEKEVRDENGRVIKERVEKVIKGEYDYSLRYDEFIAPMIKVIQAQHSEIESLKEEIALLKQQMTNLLNREVQ